VTTADRARTAPSPAAPRPLGRHGSLRALPVMLRVHFAEAIAWRAEFLIWVLAYTLPLIMLALWSAVAREAPVGRFGETEFRAYFLATLVYRMLAASWVVWDMNFQIRQGTIAARLLRPVHPLIQFAAQQAAALPLRFALATPIAIAAIAWVGTDAVSHDPLHLLALPLLLIGAWAMTFLVMAIIGSLAFFWESALGLFDLWLGFYFLFSGYLMPLELLPGPVRAIGEWLPFRYMLSFTVEVTLGLVDRRQLLHGLAMQWGWTVALAIGALATWNAGVRRYSAFGGVNRLAVAASRCFPARPLARLLPATRACSRCRRACRCWSRCSTGSTSSSRSRSALLVGQRAGAAAGAVPAARRRRRLDLARSAAGGVVLPDDQERAVGDDPTVRGRHRRADPARHPRLRAAQARGLAVPGHHQPARDGAVSDFLSGLALLASRSGSAASRRR
jgi:ABC-2 type transport system permease protein